MTASNDSVRRSIPSLVPARTLAGMALIVLACFAAYAPVFRAGFIWNDSDYVTAPELRSLAGLCRIWFKVGRPSILSLSAQRFCSSTGSGETRRWATPSAERGAACDVSILLLILLRRLAIPGAWLAASCSPCTRLRRIGGLVSERRTRYRQFSTSLLRSAIFGLSTGGNRAATCWLRFFCRRQPKQDRHGHAACGLAGAGNGGGPGRCPGVATSCRCCPGLFSERPPVCFSGWVERHFVGADGAALCVERSRTPAPGGSRGVFYAGKLVWPADLIFFISVDDTSTTLRHTPAAGGSGCAGRSGGDLSAQPWAAGERSFSAARCFQNTWFFSMFTVSSSPTWPTTGSTAVLGVMFRSAQGLPGRLAVSISRCAGLQPQRCCGVGR